MKFKIRKEIFGGGDVKYYPMVKKKALGKWYYMYKACLIGNIYHAIHDRKCYDNITKALNYIKQYKSDINDLKIISTKDILID